MRYVGRHRAPRPLLLRRPVVGGVTAAIVLAAPVLYATGNFSGAIQGGTPSKQIADGTKNTTPAGAATGSGDIVIPTDGTVVPTSGNKGTQAPNGTGIGIGIGLGNGNGVGVGVGVRTGEPVVTTTTKAGSKPTKTTTTAKPPVKTTTTKPPVITTTVPPVVTTTVPPVVTTTVPPVVTTTVPPVVTTVADPLP